MEVSSKLENIAIEGFENFKLQEDVYNYVLALEENTDSLNIELVPYNEDVSCTIDGNKNLVNGSKIVINCVNNNETDESTYTIEIMVPEEDNTLNTIVLIILITCVILALILVIATKKGVLSLEKKNTKNEVKIEEETVEVLEEDADNLEEKENDENK